MQYFHEIFASKAVYILPTIATASATSCGSSPRSAIVANVEPSTFGRCPLPLASSPVRKSLVSMPMLATGVQGHTQTVSAATERRFWVVA
jgi:hypothetical protein